MRVPMPAWVVVLLLALLLAPVAHADEPAVDEFAAAKRTMCEKYQGKVIGQKNGVDVVVTCPVIESSFSRIKLDSQSFGTLATTLRSLRKADLRIASAETLFGDRRCTGQPVSLPGGGTQTRCTTKQPFEGALVDMMVTVQGDANGNTARVEVAVDLGQMVDQMMKTQQGPQMNDVMKELFFDLVKAKLEKASTETDSAAIHGTTLTLIHRVPADG